MGTGLRLGLENRDGNDGGSAVRRGALGPGNESGRGIGVPQRGLEKPHLPLRLWMGSLARRRIC